MTEPTKKRPNHGPFIVWSPDGPMPPVVGHHSHQAAHAAAHLLAKANPGRQFMVMERSGRAISHGETE